ncbi:hypothetical protein LJK88_42990 [Paenibacillus sp. P26]|nr:hypothetical protein LJK88_42990 [Paenibacillus sp. P26]
MPGPEKAKGPSGIRAPGKTGQPSREEANGQHGAAGSGIRSKTGHETRDKAGGTNEGRARTETGVKFEPKAGTSAGVSIVVSTKRPEYFDNILDNYKRRLYKNKELVIVLHKNNINLENYRKKCGT